MYRGPTLSMNIFVCEENRISVDKHIFVSLYALITYSNMSVPILDLNSLNFILVSPYCINLLKRTG